MGIAIWLIGFLIVVFCFAVFFGAPYVPTRKLDVEEIFKNIKNSKKSKFVDLGSGDGKLVLYAAQLGYQSIGYEINPILWLISNFRLRKYPNAKVMLSNMWSADISNANVVFCFLASRYMNKLEKKLNREMQPSSIFVSYVFELPSKKPYLKHGNTLYFKF